MVKRHIAVVISGVILLLAVAGGYVALADDGPPETIASAQQAIEALPYEFTFTSPPRDAQKALVIRTTTKLGRSFRFFLFVGRAPLDIGVPSYHRENLAGGALGRRYVMLSNPSHETRPETPTFPPHPIPGASQITPAQEDEFFKIEFAVEDAICELSEGKPCPVP